MFVYCKKVQLKEEEVLQKFQNDRNKLNKGVLSISDYINKNHTFSQDICLCSNFFFINQMLITYLFNTTNEKLNGKKILGSINQEFNILVNLMMKNKCIVKNIYEITIKLIFFKVINENGFCFLLLNLIFNQHIKE